MKEEKNWIYLPLLVLVLMGGIYLIFSVWLGVPAGILMEWICRAIIVIGFLFLLVCYVTGRWVNIRLGYYQYLLMREKHKRDLEKEKKADNQKQEKATN